MGLNQVPYLAALTVAELYGGVREGEEPTKLDKLVRLFHVVAVSDEIGKEGGLYRRQYHESHCVGLVDVIIAATAEDLGADIVTLNKKHFSIISCLVVPY